MKSIIHHDQVGSIKAMQEWINICKSINVTHHLNNPKDKNLMIILIDSEKNIDNIQYPFIINTFNKVGLERIYISIIKFIYDKPIANILLSVENCKIFLYNQKKDNDAHSLHFYLTCTVLNSLATTSQRKRDQSHPN